MANRQAGRKELKGLIESELNNIDQLVAEITDYKRYNSKAYRRAKGSILHDFYNACERIFEIIARRVNGGLDETQPWHKRLLHQMSLDIKGLRPAILSKGLAAELDEYLAFRHLFRNIYGFELESEWLDRLVEKFESTVRFS